MEDPPTTDVKCKGRAAPIKPSVRWLDLLCSILPVREKSVEREAQFASALSSRRTKHVQSLLEAETY
ncbi:hypothetical protein PanWU01x14_364610 [Parasponia andersonii]|uniref:Uncharacterized protein n=1 Tax=Parasponia andersonii TaxID=3476 RepID=A0A2P5A686_PARAD|nr:hypothetical protein PanWU01x14_364610 [Parasponia andersonii]